MPDSLEISAISRQPDLNEINETSRLQEVWHSTKRLIGRCAFALSLVTGPTVALDVGEAVVSPSPAEATGAFDNDYPDMDAVDCSAVYGIYSWCKGDPYGWLSSRGYGYRNCTDGVSYWINKYTGVDPRGWDNANMWDNNAPPSKVLAGNTNNIEPGDIAQSDDGSHGHVGFITSVTKDSNGTVNSFNTAEMNADGMGHYSTHAYSVRNSVGNFSRGGSSDWDHFIDVNGVNKGLNNEDLGVASGGSTSGIDGTQVILNHAGEVWARSGVGSAGWSQEAGMGSASDIASGGGVQLILDNAGQVWARSGVGNTWTAETGQYSALEVEVGSDGTQMIRGYDNSAWAKKGVGYGNWIQEASAGSAVDVETGGGVQVIRDGAGQLWVKNTIGWGGWQAETGQYSAVEVAVSNDGTQLLRGYDNSVWARTNTAYSNWVQETSAGSAVQIAISNGVQMIRDGADQVWQKGSVGWGGWQAETNQGSAAEIAIADDGTQIIRDHADQLWARSTAAYSIWVAETDQGALDSIAD